MTRLKRLALFSVFITFCLLILGALVHNTESSLACPDWPLCYGQVFPKMEGGILVEHSHRLLASLVGFLTICLVFFSSKFKRQSEAHKTIHNITWLALFFVIAQGVLGGITVIYRLPTIVSTTHLGLSMIFFSTLIFIHHKIAQTQGGIVLADHQKLNFEQRWKPSLRHGVILSLILVYSQMLLGAFLRHSGSGAACGLGPQNSIMCLDVMNSTNTFWPSLAQAQLHMFHRFYAIIVFLVVFYYGIKNVWFFTKEIYIPKLSTLSMLSILIVLMQVCFGIATVYFNISVLPTTLHLAGAALSLATLWKLNLELNSLEQSVLKQETYSVLSDIVELTKPKLGLLVMVTVLVGLILAPGHIGFFKGLFSFALIWLVVSGAATLNCYLEREIDTLMDRTKNRPLPAKRMDSVVAFFIGFVLLGVSLPLIYFFINPLTSFLALLAAVLYLFAYTPLKRKSELAVYVGAIPGALPPVMGVTTVTGEFGAMALVLFLILFFWQLPHFLAISIFHSRDYQRADIKVYPNLHGENLTKFFISFFTFALLLISLLPFYWAGASVIYRNAAFCISGVFLVVAMQGYWLEVGEDALKDWAKKYFYGSIFYLPLLLSALIFFK